MSDRPIKILISEEDLQKHNRLDSFLNEKLTDYSRSLIKKFFLNGYIFLENREKLELKKMPKMGSVIVIDLPELDEGRLVPQNIPLEILFEDEFLVIVNKPAGLVVHPAPGNPDGTLVNAILHHCPHLAGIGNEKRPGIVHRLDKGTSGVMVVAKEQKCHEGLVKLFSTHDIERFYQAIVITNKIPPAQLLESTMGRSPHNRLKMAINVRNGKKAITHLKVVDYFERFSHVELKLETGRTHQIRVHLSSLLNSPILNDPLYGRKKEEEHKMSSVLKSMIGSYEYPFLHAKILGFVHPMTKQKLHFEIGPPPLFIDVLAQLKKEMPSE